MLMDNGTPKLPAEIVDQIIDDLALHLHALQACSLTCREWRVRSQYHLLSYIYVPNKEHIHALSIFVSRFPLRAEGICRVRISISALCGAALLQLPPLVNADTLALSAATLTTPSRLSLAPLPVIFPKLSSLKIVNWGIDRAHHRSFLCTLSRFALLRTLELHWSARTDMNTYLIEDDNYPPAEAPLPLETLTLNESYDSLCQWLSARSWRDVTALRRFELEVIRFNTTQSGFYDLLSQIAPTLHELVLHPHTRGIIREMVERAPRPGSNLKLLDISLRNHAVRPIAFTELFKLARAFAHPTCTAVIIEVCLAAPLPPGAPLSPTWDDGWTAVARELGQAPVHCASLTLVIPKLIVDRYPEAFKKVEKMLRVHGVAIRDVDRVVRSDECGGG